MSFISCTFPENKLFRSRRNFIAEGADAAMASRFSVAAAFDKSETVSSALDGLLAILIVEFFANFAVPSS